MNIRKVALLLVGLVGIWGGPLSAKPTNDQLVIGTSQEFETLNPILLQMAMSQYINGMVSRYLAVPNEEWQFQNSLATKLPSFENGMVKKITEGEKEKLLVTWEIQSGAKWGDGTPVTGKDVQLSWEIGRSPNVSVAEKQYYERIEAIILDPQNPKKFTAKFVEPQYDYYHMHGFGIVPAHLEGAVWQSTKGQPNLYEKQTKYLTNPTNPGLYMGPYLVSEVKLGSHVVLAPNPNYYGAKPKIKKIIIKLIPNTQALEANLRAGSVDMLCELGFHLDEALAMQKRAKDSDPFEVRLRESVTYEHVDLNVRDPILKDVRVRQALLYGIDRDKLVQALFEGKQKKALHMIHPLDPNYTENVVLYPYDPTKAESLLEEAGWKKGPDGIRTKEGKKLTFIMMTTAENKTRELVEVYLQSEWKKIGIETQIKNEPPRVFFGETVRKGAYSHMAMFAWVNAPDDSPKPVLHSKFIPTPANSFSGYNSGGYSNPKVDQLLDAILREFDPAKRKSMMREVMVEYTRDVPTLPLYYRVDLVVVPKSIRDFKITGHTTYSSYAVEKWFFVAGD